MGTGYTRNDVDNNIADGNVINAADFDGEFNAIVTAFSTSGHTHDGTTAEGGPISIIGPGQDITVSATIVSPKSNNAIDLGTDALEFKDIYIAGVAYIEGLGRDLLVVGTNKIEFRDPAIHINSTADGELDIVADGTIFLTADAITFGEGTETDIVLTFNATSNDGLITWMEDEDYFQFSDDILLSSTEKVQFGDPASFIQQSGDGVLRIDGEATIDLNASTAVLVSHDLKLDSDDAILGFGVNNDVTLTHIPDAALLLNDAIALQFRDNALAINSSANGQLDIIADVSLEITTPILNFDTDGQVIKFGAGDDVTLTHVHDTGLLLNDAMKIQFNDASQFIHGSSATVLSLGATAEINLTATAIDINGTLDVSGDATFNGTTNTFVSATSTKPVVVIKNTTDDASASTLRFEKDRDSANGATGDDIGTIEFKAGDSGATQEVFASILGEADVATSGQESGKLTFSVSSHDGGLEEALILVGGSLDTEVDVTIAKGLDSVTNVTGHLNVGHDFDVTGDAVIDGTALVTGVLTTTAATVFNGGFAANDGSTISTADNTDTLTLISTDADANSGPNLNLYRNSASPEDNNATGAIAFSGMNVASGANEIVDYANIEAFSLDVTDGTEDGELTFYTILAGTKVNRLDLNSTETIINSPGVDLDFRVESNNTAHLLFADGGEDIVGIGTPTPVPSNVAYKRAALHIHQEQGGSTGSQVHMTNAATGAAAGNGMFIAMWQDDDVYFTNQESDGNIKFATGGNNNVLVLDAAGAATFSSTVTADGGIDVDNFHIDGTTVALSSGNLTIDAEAGDIVLDAHGNDFILKSGATGIVLVAGDNTSGDFFMRVETADKNFLINGTDGSTAITALNLDMADAGDATFNRNIGLGASDVSIDTRLHIDACPDGKVITLEQSGRKSAIGTFFSPGSTLSRLDFFLSDGNQNGGNNNRMSILSSGDVQVKTGNLVVGTAGKGIDFSAYGAGDDIDNNLLNDYEEGTFTPVYVATGTAFGAITHDTQSGYYTRIGNVVNFSLVLRTDAFTLGSGSGSVIINGLPFSAAGIDTFPVAINAQSGWTNYMPFSGWVSSTVITLTNNAGGSDRTGYRTIPVANMTDGLDKNRIYLTGTYMTS